MRILIAEDDQTSRTMLIGVLKKDGHEVIATVNGASAWEELQKPDAPSIVILDWMMPEIDGTDVIRRVRALHTNRPPYIIMLTSKAEKMDIVEGLNAGANDYIAKPIDIGELRARVNVGSRMIELQETLARKVEELREALDHIKTLRGIVPVCANCKKIPDGKGNWKQIEMYVQEYTEVQFSHGICPDCTKKLYPGFDLDAVASKM